MKFGKRALCLVLVVLTLFCFCPVSIFAADKGTYLALGDSITTGYGLEDAGTEAFPVLLTEVLGEEVDSLVNKAVNGDTAVQLLAHLSEEAYREAVRDAQLITVTVGGNDLMALLYAFLADALGMSAEEVRAILEAGEDMETLTLAAEAINNGSFAPTEEEIGAVIDNITKIVAEIKALNADAVIVIATQYHPYENLAADIREVYDLLPLVGKEYIPLADAILKLSDTVEDALGTLNTLIAAGEGYYVADTYTAFTESDINLCNAALTTDPSVSVNLDFHPNAAGHAVIAGCMADALPADFGAETLSAPEILSCYSKLQSAVKVTWSLVDGADGYELHRSSSPDGEFKLVKTVKDGMTDRYTNGGLDVGTTYYYKVRAYTLADASVGHEVISNRVYSAFSAVSFMPAAVVFDAPYSNATSRIRLKWQEVDGAHGYQIWREQEDGSYAIVKTIGDKGDVLTSDMGDVTAYSNTGLQAGDIYTYKMRAFMITEDGQKVFGAYSDAISVAVMPEIPVTHAESDKETRATVTWEAVNGAAGYQIWMADAEDGVYRIAKSVTDPTQTSYTVRALESGATYLFRVRAYTELDGKKTFGMYSDAISVTIN